MARLNLDLLLHLHHPLHLSEIPPPTTTTTSSTRFFPSRFNPPAASSSCWLLWATSQKTTRRTSLFFPFPLRWARPHINGTSAGLAGRYVCAKSATHTSLSQFYLTGAPLLLLSYLPTRRESRSISAPSPPHRTVCLPTYLSGVKKKKGHLYENYYNP